MKKIEYYNMLKPCPKCGSKHLRVTHWKTMGFTTRFAIDCYDCDYTIAGRSRRRVLKRWGIHQPQSARGNRSKIIYPLYNRDGTIDYLFDKETLDGVLAPFCKERESNDIDDQILYVSSKGSDNTELESGIK